MTISRLAFRSSAVACAVFGARMFVSVPAAAEEAAPEEAWRVEKTKLEQVIEERIKEDVDKNVTDKQVAEQLGMKWPVKPPPKTKEEIAAAVEIEIDADAAVKYPDSKRKDFEKEAAEKYRVYETGDLVDFSIRNGMGPNPQVKGRLYDKTTMRLKIGSRYVLRTDMAEETTARFWEDVSEEYKNKYIRVQNIRYDAKINAYKEVRRKVRLPQALEAARYIHPRDVKDTTKLDVWFAESAVLQHFYDKRKKAYEDNIRPDVTEQVFMSNGFVMVEDTVNKTKEWVPKQQEASFREKIRAMLEQKKEEEDAAKEEAKNPPGMMGPGMMGPGMMGGQPGMMGGQPGMGSGMPGGAQPGMMGPGMMGPGAGSGKPAAGASAPDAGKGGGKTPFDEDPW